MFSCLHALVEPSGFLPPAQNGPTLPVPAPPSPLPLTQAPFLLGLPSLHRSPVIVPLSLLPVSFLSFSPARTFLLHFLPLSPSSPRDPLPRSAPLHLPSPTWRLASKVDIQDGIPAGPHLMAESQRPFFTAFLSSCLLLSASFYLFFSGNHRPSFGQVSNPHPIEEANL